MSEKPIFRVSMIVFGTCVFIMGCAHFNGRVTSPGLATLHDAVSHRASSSDPNWQFGNGDARAIKPADTLVLAELEGPGVINHIWNTVASLEPKYSRLLLLRMYWDGEENPSVECPLGDFFGVGHGMDISFESQQIAVANGKGRNCYWPMPFRKSAKITVTNEGQMATDAFYYQIDWEKVGTLDGNTAYLHAMYRQEYPCAMDSRYLIADIEGRGHYVGTVLSVRQRLESWFGEGDDFFYVDGETEPSVRGTGTEDYFCDGWGFHPVNTPYYGVPLFEGLHVGARASAYRWHVTDPVRFNKSLRLEIEHVGPSIAEDGTPTGYGERPDDFSSAAFWYQAEPHKTFPAIPKGYGRFYSEPLTSDPFLDGSNDQLISFWLRASLAQIGIKQRVVRVDSQMFGGADLAITVPNTTSLPMKFTAVPGPHPHVTVRVSPDEVLVPSKGEATINLRFEPSKSPDVTAIEPVPIEWRAVFTRPQKEPLEVSAPFRFLIEKPLTVEKTTAPMKIDGILNEWAELPYVCTIPAMIKVGTKEWDGPEDCSFRFGVKTDGNYLYIAVDVTDDKLIVDPEKKPWDQDGIEVRVAAMPDAQRSSWNGREEFGPALLVGMSPRISKQKMILYEPESLPDGLQAVCVKTDTGYATEIAVPVAYLDERQGKPWEQIRLNIGVDDIDGPDVERSQIWWRPDWRMPQTYDDSGTFVRP